VAVATPDGAGRDADAVTDARPGKGGG
jgi:hypothetical protein